jgi:hypothetical protein
MVHPTCALARPPDVPPIEDSPSDPNQTDSAALITQAAREINEVREAHQAAVYVRRLVVWALSAHGEEARPNATESRSLLGFLEAEIERRIQLAKATITSLMQSP